MNVPRIIEALAWLAALGVLVIIADKVLANVKGTVRAVLPT